MHSCDVDASMFLSADVERLSQDCGVEMRDNRVRGNRSGSVAIGDSSDVDSVDVAAQNMLDRPPSRLEYR